MKQLHSFLVVITLILFGCSDSKDNPSQGAAPTPPNILGYWQQTGTVSANGTKSSYDVSKFRSSFRRGDSSFIHIEISDSMFSIYALDSNSQGWVSFSKQSSTYSFVGNTIKTSDGPKKEFSDFQVESSTENELTLKYLGPGDQVSLILKRVTKEEMEKVINEFSSNTFPRDPGQYQPPSIGELDSDPSVQKIKGMGIDVEIYYQYLSNEDIQSFKNDLPQIAAELTKYRSDIKSVILSKSMTTSYYRPTQTLTISAGNSLNKKISQFLRNNHKFVEAEREYGVWITGVSLDVDSYVDQALQVLERERRAFKILAKYVSEVDFSRSELPQFYLRQGKIIWPSLRDDAKNHGLYSQAFQEAARAVDQVYGACPKVDIMNSTRTLGSEADARDAYGLLLSAARNLQSVRYICDQYDQINFENEAYDIPRNAIHIGLLISTMNQKRTLQVFQFMFLRVEDKKIDSMIKGLGQLSQFETAVRLKVELGIDVNSGFYYSGLEDLENFLAIVKGFENQISRINVKVIEMKMFGSLEIKGEKLIIPTYVNEEKTIERYRRQLRSLL